MVNSLSSIRKLTAALLVSGSFNVILVAFILYWGLRERPPTPYCELKPASQSEEQTPLAIDHSNSEVVRYFRKMPMEWLVNRLGSTQLVENGYTQRDLALACLVAFYHFDLERALKGLPLPTQKRSLVYGKLRSGQPAILTVYPGLSDTHFAAIKAFASVERWPLTSYGLFTQLKKIDIQKADPLLLEAFFMTPEYHAVEMLFSRISPPINQKLLLLMVLQGNWSLVKALTEQQKLSQDLSVARRQRFLLDQIQHQSKAAATILLQVDGSFAVRKLDDKDVLQILELLDEKSSESEQFALALLTSPRSDSVWKQAAMRLYAYAGEPLPTDYSHRAAIARFAPNYKTADLAEVSTPLTIKTPEEKTASVSQTPVPVPTSKSKPVSTPTVALPPKQVESKSYSQPSKTTTQAKAPRQRLYIVREGDTLWILSRRFNIDVETLKAFNKLDSDVLHPGKPLYIPVK